jgi:hypothetical protein
LSNILINGLVAIGDKGPCISMSLDGHAVEMTIAEARNIARDIEAMCARTAADAMIHQFFVSFLKEFREYRAAQETHP